jgi:hypothetical protein
MTKSDKYWWMLICGLFIGLILIIYLIGVKALVLSVSIFSLLCYFNVAITTLGNSFSGKVIDNNYDIFWKLLFISIASIGFGIYFNI